MLSKTIDVPYCAACIMGKQVRESSGAKRETAVKSGVLSCNVLTPGQVIYHDQFSARVKGRGSTNPLRSRSERGIFWRNSVL